METTEDEQEDESASTSTFRLLPMIFSAMVKASMVGASSGVENILAQAPLIPIVESWENIGEMPIVKVKSLLKRIKIRVFTSLFNAALKLPSNETRWGPHESVEHVAEIFYGQELLNLVPASSQRDHSMIQLYEQITIGGFYHLKKYGEDEGILDLSFLEKFEVREGYSIYGGKAVISFDRMSVTSLISPTGEVVTPRDPTWEYETMRFRSSLFAFLTFIPHSVWCHGMIAPKFFIAVHSLPHNHILRTFLTPFVHGVDQNVTRAKVTVFGKTGVLSLASAFTENSVAQIMKEGVNQMEVKLPNELFLSKELKAVIEPIWDAIHELTTEFLKEVNLDHDEALDGFLKYLSQHANPRFAEMDPVDVITYMIFTSTVSHHLWGHLYFGSTSPTYVSANVLRYAEESNVEFSKLAEPIDVTIMRLGVIISTRRAFVKLSTDFSCTTHHNNARLLFYNFSNKMRKFEEADELISLYRVASSGML